MGMISLKAHLGILRSGALTLRLAAVGASSVAHFDGARFAIPRPNAGLFYDPFPLRQEAFAFGHGSFPNLNKAKIDVFIG